MLELIKPTRAKEIKINIAYSMACFFCLEKIFLILVKSIIIKDPTIKSKMLILKALPLNKLEREPILSLYFG